MNNEYRTCYNYAIQEKESKAMGNILQKYGEIGFNYLVLSQVAESASQLTEEQLSTSSSDVRAIIEKLIAIDKSIKCEGRI